MVPEQQPTARFIEQKSSRFIFGACGREYRLGGSITKEDEEQKMPQ